MDGAGKPAVSLSCTCEDALLGGRERFHEWYWAVTIEPIGLEDLKFARNAHIQYGKGSGHPAQLNFGDCFSYACARHHDVPLMFKGADFTRTDIEAA